MSVGVSANIIQVQIDDEISYDMRHNQSQSKDENQIIVSQGVKSEATKK